MNLRIGDRFTIGGAAEKVWQVTDVGSRVIVAIPVTDGWMAGPPYALTEVAFDEHDQEVMTQISAT